MSNDRSIMPLRLPCLPVQLTPGSLLYSYWGALGYHRPILDLYIIGPSLRISQTPAQIDTASDYVILGSRVASQLGLALPFPRSTGASGMGGSQVVTFSFPPDSLVSLFVTDYREYAFLPSPIVGFHSPGPGAASQRSVLGQTGFLQFFRFLQDPEPIPPIVELDLSETSLVNTAFCRGTDRCSTSSVACAAGREACGCLRTCAARA
jgi:hypothetical protein